MSASNYPHLRAVDFIKRQPAYNLLFVSREDQVVTLGANDEAFDIVTACTGLATVNEVNRALADKYQDDVSHVRSRTERFFDQLERIGILTFTSRPADTHVRVLGTKEHFTPEYVIIELTSRCPLRCEHCYLDAGRGPVMDYAFLRVLLSQLTNEVGVRSIQLTGGEPFLYDHLSAAVEFLNQNKVATQVTTSGFILNNNAKRALSYLTGPRCSVQVSVDGLEARHNAIRGNSRSFGRAMNFIAYATSVGVSVSTGTSLISQPEREIEELCLAMRAKGVRHFRLGVVSMQGRATQLDERHVWSNDQALELRARLSSRYGKATFDIGVLEDVSATQSAVNCGAGTRLITIDPEFRVRPCVMMGMRMGDLRRESLDTIMMRAAPHMQRLQAPTSEFCDACRLTSKCNKCIAEGLTNHSRVPTCKWYEQAGEIVAALTEEYR